MDTKIISVNMNNNLINCLSKMITQIDNIYKDGIDPKYQKIN